MMEHSPPRFGESTCRNPAPTSTGASNNIRNPPPSSTGAPNNGVQHHNRDNVVNQQQAAPIPVLHPDKPQLPPFMKDRPDIWFILIESEFTASRTINDDVKYSATLRALDTDTLHKITDIICAPPAAEKYRNLKEVIIRRATDSRQKQIHRLLNDLVLGDKKPSQLLREMKGLAGDGLNDDMLHNLWVSRLPSSIKPLLIISEALNLDALAEMADRLIETVTMHNSTPSSQPSTVAAVNHSNFTPTSSTSSTERKLDDLQSALSFCMKEILDMKSQMQSNNNRQSRSRTRSNSYSRDRSQSNQSSICFYHRKFGHNAKHCTSPCTFTSSNNQGN